MIFVWFVWNCVGAKEGKNVAAQEGLSQVLHLAVLKVFNICVF